MSDPTLDFDVLSILAKNPDAVAASAPVSFAPAVPDVKANNIQVTQNLDDSALAVIDQWTEKSEKEEAMDQWTALNATLPSTQQEANSETVADFDSAMDAVEKWTQEEEEEDANNNNNNRDENGTVLPQDDEGSVISEPLVLAVSAPEPNKQMQEIERLRSELVQAQQEIEALETSTNLYRMQLKQAKEMQRVRSLEVEHVKSTNDQALEQALQAQVQLQATLKAANENQSQLKAVIEAKDQEIIKLKLDNHEFPSKILKLQSDIEAEKGKFKSLVDRFNSVKEMELHRQKQRFLTVSAQQKDVFDRLHGKYNEAVHIAKSHADQIAQLEQQLASRDKEIGKMHAIFNQARQEIANERGKFLQLKVSYDNLKAEFDQESATKKAAITEIEQKLQSTESEVRSMKEREQEQQRMQCYFNCAHNYEPEIGDEIRVLTQDCGEISSYEWFRAASAGGAYQLIEDQTRDVYTATADDLGRVLKMNLTNSAGLSISVEIGPIALSPAMGPKLHEYLLFKKEIEFSVKSSTSAFKNGRTILLTKDKAKLREGKSTLIKEQYGPNVSVVLDAVDDTKIGDANLATHKGRLSQMGSFSQKFPSHQPRSTLAEHAPVSRHTSTDIKNPQDANSRSMSLKPTSEESALEYDADGYIIRRDVDTQLANGLEKNELGDDGLPQPSIPPIVIKPQNEAVEATPEELSRAALKFDKPPQASTSKPKPAISEEKPKKKKKKDKPDESIAENSATSSPTK